MDKQQVKALAEKHGVKKPMMKSDYSEAFYAFAAELFQEGCEQVSSGFRIMIENHKKWHAEDIGKIRRLRDEAEKLRLKGEGDGKVTTAQLSEVLDGK